MRKQSDSTKLRHALREIRTLRLRHVNLFDELNRRRSVGSLMANVMFNLKQRDDRDQKLYANLQEQWDAIKRES